MHAWDEALSLSPSYSWNGISGHLATVTSETENDFIYEAFVGPRYETTSGSERENANAWIAISDQGTEGTWRWMAGPEEGSIASFLHWNTGEPNDSNNEDYAVIHWQDRGLGRGRWYDYVNDGYFGGHHFVVEFEEASECY